MPKGSAWMTVQVLRLHWRMHKPRTLHTTTTGTRYGFNPFTKTLTFLWSSSYFNYFFIFIFLNSSMAVGDRTPGGNTPSITSITNIILLPQHDGEKFQDGDSEESIFSCPTLNRTLQLVVMEISVQPQIRICSFWFLVRHQLNLVAIVWNRTIFSIVALLLISYV